MNHLSELWNKLDTLPKPVTEEQILTLAREAARNAGNDFRQFEQWFATEKTYVIDMLNNQSISK